MEMFLSAEIARMTSSNRRTRLNREKKEKGVNVENMDVSGTSYFLPILNDEGNEVND